MRVSPFRLFELAVTFIACVVVGNALMNALTGTPDQLKALAQNKALIEVLAAAWLLALFCAPKQMPRL